jgi:hypothetical protein
VGPPPPPPFNSTRDPHLANKQLLSLLDINRSNVKR